MKNKQKEFENMVLIFSLIIIIVIAIIAFQYVDIEKQKSKYYKEHMLAFCGDARMLSEKLYGEPSYMPCEKYMYDYIEGVLNK